jgi:mono/diheme cytochrome c family protein
MPEGTVPYGAGPIARPQPNPTRGARVYGIYCKVCHGERGAGDGPIIGRFPNPPSLTSAKAIGMDDNAVFTLMTEGRGLMASYAAQVPAADRWHLVDHLRLLQQGKP